MKVRLTLDINSGHLALTTLDLLLPLDPRGELEAIESVWHGARAPFACLSVRTALDMLLESLEHQSGDEILLSAMTLPTMATVIRSHDLVPVPVDVDPVTMAPSLEQLEERAGPRTRLFLFAHLFGGRSPLDGAMELCRKRGIPVVEDCAQAWWGPGWTGHRDALASLFSFGTIKSPTALGGAIAEIRDPALLEKMKALREETPVQSRWRLAGRILKVALIGLLTTERSYGLLRWALDRNGVDVEAILRRATRGFPSDGIPEGLRYRPPAAQSRLLRRRIEEGSRKWIEDRIEIAEDVASRLPSGWRLVGGEGSPHSHWVFPVAVPEGIEVEKVCGELRQAGFDASREAALDVIEAPEEHPGFEASVARDVRARMVFLPLHPPLPPERREHLLATLDACAVGALR